MHEQSITNEIVHQIVHACEDNMMLEPKKITVELGVLSSYKKEPLLHYFEDHKKEIGILKDAELDVIEVPGKIYCNSCCKESILESYPAAICPICSSADIKVIAGEDVIIKEISD